MANWLENYSQYLTEERHEFRLNDVIRSWNSWYFEFPNGTAASVVCHICKDGTYFTSGSETHPFELMPIGIFLNLEDPVVPEDFPVRCSDVAEYLDDSEVESVLDYLLHFNG